MNNTKWFSKVDTVEGLKKQYRNLAKKYHPDHGGDENTFKEIQNEFESILESFMFSSFSSYEEKYGKEANGNMFVFADILKEIISFNMKIEIIGYWIYCFNSFEYKDVLKQKGFWFSKKHKAWVYSGGKKIKRATKHTIDSIKNHYGFTAIREKEEQLALTTG